MSALLAAPVRLAVLLYQSLAMALGQIWSSKLRALLTTLGIVIGVGAVTSVIAVLTGLENKVKADLQTFGTNSMFAFPQLPAGAPIERRQSPDFRFRPDLFDDLLRFCPSVGAYTRIADFTAGVRHGVYLEPAVTVVGVDAAWHDIERRAVTVGRRFGTVEFDSGVRVALVTPKLQQQLALDRDPAGQEIFVGGERFLCVGVVEEEPQRSVLSFGSSDLQLVVPMRAVLRMRPREFIVLSATARQTEQVREAVAEVKFFLRKRRNVAAGEADDFRVEYVEQFVQQFERLALAVQLVAAGVVGISLLVGGVGIMNIMLVSVSERTREIGLRKAVGARPGAILLQFLIEAIVLCCAGGLVGVGLGWALTRAIANLPGAGLTGAAIPTWAVVLGLGFSVATGVVFGMFPAIKAARLDPIEALRHE